MLTAGAMMWKYLKAFRKYDDLAFCSSLSGDMAQYGLVIHNAVLANRNLDTEILTLRAEDGVTLVADFYRANVQPRGTVILVHGFRGAARGDFSCAISLYHELGWDLLLIDQRAQGRSGGRRMGLGVLEKNDVVTWTRLVAERAPGKPIILGGISMGASTVMMACGLPLPQEVRGVIADCGFTSPYDIFQWLLRREHLPLILLPVFSLLARPVLGYGLKDCSTVDALAHSTLPILLIHGEADRFLPCEMSRRNFESAAAPDKTLITIPGATHGMAYLIQPELCRTALMAFIERNGAQSNNRATVTK